MTSKTHTVRRRAGWWLGVGLGMATLAAPGLASASSVDLFYERTVMTAADSRCGLFTSPVGSALAAARAQARGAALRAGADRATLMAVERRASQKAGAVACDSADLDLAASRVRTAFEGYAKLIKMDYPGDVSQWRADRSSSVAGARWRLTQDTQFEGGRMVFGLAGRVGANRLMAIVNFEGGGAPYAARLVLRDVDLTLGPYLDERGESLERLPLTRRLPPVTAQTAFSAEARSRAGLDLLPKDLKSGWAFRFPAEAARTLSGLDPREAVMIEFLFEGQAPRRAYIEVGDFAAGRAFLQVANR